MLFGTGRLTFRDDVPEPSFWSLSFYRTTAILTPCLESTLEVFSSSQSSPLLSRPAIPLINSSKDTVQMCWTSPSPSSSHLGALLSNTPRKSLSTSVDIVRPSTVCCGSVNLTVSCIQDCLIREDSWYVFIRKLKYSLADACRADMSGSLFTLSAKTFSESIYIVHTPIVKQKITFRWTLHQTYIDSPHVCSARPWFILVSD